MTDRSSKQQTLPQKVATRVVEAVCELPDYTSPDDQPDLVMCTVQELENCVLRAFEQLEYDEEMAQGPPDETPAFPTDWEKARAAVAAVVQTLHYDERQRLGAVKALHAIAEGMRGTPASPEETSPHSHQVSSSPPAGGNDERHASDCNCLDCLYFRKHPQLSPHHPQCGCSSCAQNGNEAQ